MLGALRNATPSQVGVPSPLQAPVTEPRHGVALAKTEESKAIRGRPASAARLGVAPKGAKTEESKAAQQKVNIPLPVSETGTGRFGLGGRESPRKFRAQQGATFISPHRSPAARACPCLPSYRPVGTQFRGLYARWDRVRRKRQQAPERPGRHAAHPQQRSTLISSSKH